MNSAKRAGGGFHAAPALNFFVLFVIASSDARSERGNPVIRRDRSLRLLRRFSPRNDRQNSPSPLFGKREGEEKI